MTLQSHSYLRGAAAAIGLLAGAAHAHHTVSPPPVSPPALPSLTLQDLKAQLKVGDVVFIHVKALPFDKISEATQSWVNHVGIVVAVEGEEAVVAESAFPLSRTTTLSRFVRRSQLRHVAVARLATPLNTTQSKAIAAASKARLGVLYDTGFDLESERQYCSRFVHEVLDQATGIRVGEAESFESLLQRNPKAGLGFWRLWFFGRIPWERQTVTPASLYRSRELRMLFDGHIA